MLPGFAPRPRGRALAFLFSFVACAGISQAQSAGAADRLRSLNRQLSNAALTAPETERLLMERSGALYSLMDSDPAAALQLALPSRDHDRLRALAPGRADLVEVSGEWQGAAIAIVEDDFARGAARTRWHIRLSGEPAVRLYFAGPPPSLPCERELKVNGVRLRDRIVARTATVVRIAADSCNTTTGVQKTAILLVSYPTFPLSPFATQDFARNLFVGPGRSVNGYLAEASYNQISLAPDVFGPFLLDREYQCYDIRSIQDAAIRAADGVADFNRYNRLFVLMPHNYCSYSGTATFGCESLNSPTKSFNASTSWIPVWAPDANTAPSDIGLMNNSAHEFGHNLGLSHARSLDFGSEPLGASGGARSEYGDPFSIMGHSFNWGHFNAQEKFWTGWIADGLNVATVESNGSFTLKPIEIASNSLQAIRVRRGRTEDQWLWVEYRQPSDYELWGWFPAQAYTGALIHYETPASREPKATDLLDFNPTQFPNDFDDAGLPVGRTWSDPYSPLTLTIDSIDAAGLHVTVFYRDTAFPSADSLTFTAAAGSSTPQSQTLTLTASASGMSYTAAVSYASGTGNWLAVSPASGSIPASLTITINPAALPVGTHYGSVDLTVPGASNSPLKVPVTLTIAASSPAGYWTFDSGDISGNVVLDRSGHSLNGIMTGAAAVPGKINQALSFNGAGSYVAIPGDDPSLQLTHDLTLTAWVKTTNSTQKQNFIGKYDYSGQESGYLLQVQPWGAVNLHLGGSNVGSGNRDATTSTTINDGQWHHVAVVIAVGQTTSFYVDGGAVWNSSQVSFASGNGAPLYLGTSPGAYNGSPFTGSLDSVAIYARRLTLAEIQSLAGISGPAVPAISYLTPPSPPQGSGFTLTLTGSGFDPGTIVTAGGTALQTSYVSPAQVTAVVPDAIASCARTLAVQAWNGYPSGAASNALDFTITPVKPVITSLSPSSAGAGGPAFQLTINGTGFLSGDCANGPLTVKWNGQVLTSIFVSSTRLTASVPAALIATAGTASVAVANPGSTLFSDAATFTVSGAFTMSCVPGAGPVQTGVAYSSTCSASGGTPPYTWTVSAGALPAGLSLSATSGTAVTISGAPTTAGAYTYTIRAADSATPAAHTASQSFSGSIAPVSPPSGGPAGWWTFDAADIAGNTALDKTANHWNGTIVNALPAAGRINEALSFSGVNSYVAVADNLALQLNHDLTIAAWIKTTGGAQKQNFVSKYDFSGAEYGYLLQVLPSGALNLHVGGNNLVSGSRDAPDSRTIADGQWHHVAAVITLGQDVRFYVDGQLSSTQPLVARATNNTAVLYLGTYPGSYNGSPFTGSLDDVRIYAQALAASAVQEIASVVPAALSLDCSPAEGPRYRGLAYTQTCTAAGGTPPYAFTATGLPSGMTSTKAATTITLSALNFALVNGPYAYTVAVTDSAAHSASRAFSGQVTDLSAPVVTSVSPPSWPAGTKVTLSVKGSGFYPGAVLVVCTPSDCSAAAAGGRANRSTFISSTEISVPLKIDFTYATSTLRFKVFNLGDTVGSADSFFPVTEVVPVISSISPASVVAGSAGFTLRIQGMNFFNHCLDCYEIIFGTRVYWNGVAIGTGPPIPLARVISSTELEVAVSTDLIAAAGTAMITVNGPQTTHPSNAVPFTITTVPPPSTLTPSAYWTFDAADIIGNQAKDKSANALNGTIVNALAAPGRVREALAFSGAGSYVAVPDNLALQLSHDLTLAAWIKTTNTTQKQNFISKYDFTGAEYGYLLQVLPSGALNLHVGGNNLASAGRDASDTKPINDGQWHHVAAVISLGQNVKFYVDGQLSSTQPLVVVAGRNGAVLYLGTYPGSYNGSPFTGSLDEVWIANRALTAADVAILATGGS